MPNDKNISKIKDVAIASTITGLSMAAGLVDTKETFEITYAVLEETIHHTIPILFRKSRKMFGYSSTSTEQKKQSTQEVEKEI